MHFPIAENKSIFLSGSSIGINFSINTMRHFSFRTSNSEAIVCKASRIRVTAQESPNLRPIRGIGFVPYP